MNDWNNEPLQFLLPIKKNESAWQVAQKMLRGANTRSEFDDKQLHSCTGTCAS